jgi:lysophospholipase L1-like esterase
VNRTLVLRARSIGGFALAFLLVAGFAAWLALIVTPAQSVSTAGQTLRVGAARPGLTSFSGPGELDLFGQAMPTRQQFSGLIRPRLELTHITIDDQLTQFMQTSDRHSAANGLSSALVSGWRHYFVWQTLVTAGFAVVLLLAIAGVRHYPRPKMMRVVGLGTVIAVAVNVTAVVAFAAGTPGTLRQVRSLDDLVGSSQPGATPSPVGAARPGVQAVVIGDSTAAAIGNPPVSRPTALDTACGRSADSYAADLAAVNGWNVLNLACSGATVSTGILGVQNAGNQVAPPQFGVLEQANRASVVAVSVGANDLQWHTMTALCALAATCDDQASTAYFQSNLADFTKAYYQLLHDLAGLPQHPRVLINEYFVPFGSDLGCLSSAGFNAAKVKVLLSRLGNLNTVLEAGAQTFGFTAVQQRFDGHELCTPQPYVQGLHDSAPLHPTAAGELAIALADQQALARPTASVNAEGGPAGG